MTVEVLLGDEAVALGAIHAGISGAFSYPGTPATEIFEYVERQARAGLEVYARWSPNEKVAYEEALGMSWTGKRAIVSMKHVGLNVAADAFVNSALTGVGGGLVVVVADDPGMHSSQNEQDTRALAAFAQVPCLEPRDQQEAYAMMAEGLDLSERLDVPVVVRIVTRLAHSRAPVQVRETPRAPNPLRPAGAMSKWTLLPAIARQRYHRLVELTPELQRWSATRSGNELTLRGRRLGVLAAGLASNYLTENLTPDHDLSILHVGSYPPPVEKIRALTTHVDRLLVLEEGYPHLEDHLLGLLGPRPGLEVLGQRSGHVPRTGELTPDLVRAALAEEPWPALHEALTDLPGRPPMLCQGCPHIDLYQTLNLAMADYPGSQVFSDIGCYTLGALPPLLAIHSCVCMGASIGMALGAAEAGASPVVAVIGDSTFAHAGIPALLSAAKADVPLTLIIVDNDYVAMTGGQQTMLTGERLDRLVLGLGVPEAHFRVITPLKKNQEDNLRVLREEIAHPGLSVVVSRRVCIQKKAPAA